jgi:hypothetical protein
MTITDLAVRLTAIESRLETIERRLAELDALKQVVGDLKFEIENMQEA